MKQTIHIPGHAGNLLFHGLAQMLHDTSQVVEPVKIYLLNGRSPPVHSIYFERIGITWCKESSSKRIVIQDEEGLYYIYSIYQQGIIQYFPE